MKTKWNWLFDRPGRSRKSLGAHTARRLCVEDLENRLLLTAVTLDWAFGIGSGETRDESYDVATDAAGNSYMAGWFSGSMDFDPGPGTHTLMSLGLHDTFVAKYTSAGVFVWATQLGGPGNDSYDYAYSIAVDGFGDAVVTGAYGAGALFGTISLINNGVEDAYVAKLRGDTGNVVWANGLGGTDRDFGRSVAVNMNVTGTGAGDVYIGGSSVVNGTRTFFLAKYGVSGTQDWVKQVTSFANSVAVDSSTGSVFTNGRDFTQKLDSNGNVLWTKGIPGQDITVDSTGNTYITGGFSGRQDFDPGSGKLILTSAGGIDVHVTKLDQNGNLGWAKRIGGKGDDEGRNIALDSANNVYVAGHFSGKVDFNPRTGTSYLTSVGSRDIFVVKLDSGANFVWAGSLGGTVDESIWGMAVDSSDNVLLTGYFSGVLDVDPGSAVHNLTSNGGYDSFLVKLKKSVALLASSSATESSVTKNSDLRAMASPANAKAVSSRRNEKKETAHLIDAVFSDAPDLLWYPAFSDRASIDLLDWDSLDLLGS